MINQQADRRSYVLEISAIVVNIELIKVNVHVNLV